MPFNPDAVRAITIMGIGMPRIALEHVEVGMQLSKSVSNDAGVKLIAKGTVVTDKVLQKLANANVHYVFVANTSDPARLEQELAALEARFAKTGERPHMEGLKKLLREHLEELYPC